MKNAHISEFKLSFSGWQMKYLAKVKNSWNLKQKSSGPYFESYSTRSCLFTGQSIKHKCHFGLHFWQIFLKCTSLFDDGSICRRGKVHFSKYSHEDLTKTCIKIIRGCLTIYSESNEWQRVRYKGLLFLSTLLQATSNTRASMIKIQWLSSGNLDQIIWWW